jgi:hypothetical protein
MAFDRRQNSTGSERKEWIGLEEREKLGNKIRSQVLEPKW